MKTVSICITVIFLLIPASVPANPSLPQPYPATGFALVDTLLYEGKKESACISLNKIMLQAISLEDEESWTRALVRQVQLRVAMKQYEKAVDLMLNTPWPQKAEQRNLTNLYYGYSLNHYLSRNRHSIRGNATKAGGRAALLKDWTIGDFRREINSAYYQVLLNQGTLSENDFGDLQPYLSGGSFPSRIRGTARDAVTYLWVMHLRNTTYWSASHHEETKRFSASDFLTLNTDEQSKLDSDEIHPLKKIHKLLVDLALNHQKNGRQEAALDVMLQLSDTIHDHIRIPVQNSKYIDWTEELLSTMDKDLPWWSKGMWNLGSLYEEENGSDNLIKAVEIFQQGARQHPHSVGGSLCIEKLETLQRPDYSLKAMPLDGHGKRSIQIRHRNISRVYFRAWRIDLFEELRNGREISQSAFTDGKETERLLKEIPPNLQWSQVVPDMMDFQYHFSYASLPEGTPGAYVVAASLEEDFREKTNILSWFDIFYTDLVISRWENKNELYLDVSSGLTGQPVPDVQLDVFYLGEWEDSTKSISLRTDARGQAMIPMLERSNYLVYAQKGQHESWLKNKYFSHSPKEKNIRSSIIYTDRRIFRPGQNVMWKVVSFKSEKPRTDFQTLPHDSLTVELFDANRKLIHREIVVTNNFGSVSGSFEIPVRGVLGQWTLRTSSGQKKRIKVEEYKRPTFEVSVDTPAGEVHLGEQVRLLGHAQYYFAQPVASGSYRWSISRNWVRPRFWRHRQTSEAVPIYAEGKGELGSDGSFEIEFEAASDDQFSQSEIQAFRFSLKVEVTNEGGETIETIRNFRIGLAAVQATIISNNRVVLAQENADFEILRTDLNNKPQPGTGSLSVCSLIPPREAVLPSERPVRTSENTLTIFETPGDLQKPRWANNPHWLADIAHWPEGPEVSRKEIHHDVTGLAEVTIPDLPAGPYRVIYSTTDQSGKVSLTRHEFIVAGPKMDNLPVCLLVATEKSNLKVGETARILVHSGLPNQLIHFSIHHNKNLLVEKVLTSGKDSAIIEFPINETMRGGLHIGARAISDYQHFSETVLIHVPWDNKHLDLELLTLNERLRCGNEEKIRVKMRRCDGQPIKNRTELLAYMYDRSLDAFGLHQNTNINRLFLHSRHPGKVTSGLDYRGRPHTKKYWEYLGRFNTVLIADHLAEWRFGIYSLAGQLYVRGGRSGQVMTLDSGIASSIPMASTFTVEGAEYMVEVKSLSVSSGDGLGPQEQDADSPVRSQFIETAFFNPHLDFNNKGEAEFEFTVPETVTDWNLELHALTEDLKHGHLKTTITSSQDLLVRPSFPRFFREGDRAEIKVLLNNSTDQKLRCKVDFSIYDEETGENITASFGLSEREHLQIPVNIEAGEESVLMFPLSIPDGIGLPVFEVVGRTSDLSDGERRPVPILPGRVHLMESKFAAIDGLESRSLIFKSASGSDDSSLDVEKIVVTIDAQLFESALAAVPYLINYPYECTEQTLNRYLSSSIMSQLYADFPESEKWSEEVAGRDTRYEPWNSADPNRRLQLEESPWLLQASGGFGSRQQLFNILDPKTARESRQQSLDTLSKLQVDDGGFGWFSGGPSSFYNTAYILHGLTRGNEFGVETPDVLSGKAWVYLFHFYESNLLVEMKENDRGWTSATYLASLMSNPMAQTWGSEIFDTKDKLFLLDFSFRHWLKLSRMMKAHLSLALWRNNRHDEAKMVFESVMDESHQDKDQGIFWETESQAWRWSRDSIESHAMILRVMNELNPDDKRADGLVKWLLLNRHLNQWKSTRATAEVIYALAHHMKNKGTLNFEQRVAVKTCVQDTTIVFQPGEFSGKDNHLVYQNAGIQGSDCNTVKVENQSRDLIFASATRHFSTTEWPPEGQGDVLSVKRSYYLRTQNSEGWVLTPLDGETEISVGDQMEVHLHVGTKIAMEFVQLRDPRPSGFEPETKLSGHSWQSGLVYYREIRDNGMNYFMDGLPTGDYQLIHRMRATVAGKFKVAPATLQSIYSPEFTAYSSGALVTIAP
ncbi:MAG: hypothetical protein GY780_10655 [bacterium]|nr:hypothetical protein [bacterium]